MVGNMPACLLQPSYACSMLMLIFLGSVTVHPSDMPCGLEVGL